MYQVLTVLLALALLATIRLSLPRPVAALDRLPLRPLFHPAWLVTLILAAYLALGMYFAGTLSPWPIAAFATWNAAEGWWAGAAAFLAALTTDLWLLWTATEALRRHTPPDRQHTLRYLHLFNLLIGGAVIGLAVSL